MITRKTHIAVASLAFGAAMLVGAAGNAADFTLRFNHVLGPSEPYHKGFQNWAKKVEERTKGGLEIKVYHSAQLGVEEDIIEQIRQGANIGQNTDSARLGNYVPGIAVINGPYFVTSFEEAYSLADSPTVKEWNKELAEKHGLKVVCFDWIQGFRNFFTKKPIHTPADLKGLRIRTPAAPIWQESIRALGAEPVALNFGDVYPGLQQGAVDGAELVYPNITAGNLREVIDYASETKHILLVNFQVISSQWFNKLPGDYQTALVEECRAAGQETSKVIQDATEKAKQTLIGQGLKVVEDVDMAAFQAAGKKAYEVLGISDAAEKVWKDLGK